MDAVLTWFRTDVRARWRSLVLLALLVAFAGGTVMTAVAGARRGATAVDRLHERTLPATAVVLPNEPGFDWEAIRDFPEVLGLTEFVVTDFQVEDLRDVQAGFPPADDEVFRTIERPVVLDGRLPDPASADEVVISPRFEDIHGRGVGDELTLRLYTPAQSAQLSTGGAPVPAEGPAIEAEIVGVIRSPWFADKVGVDAASVHPSSALYEQYEENLVDPGGSTVINALVRLDGGEPAIPGFKDRLANVTGRPDIDVWNEEAAADHDRDVTAFESNSLLLFALAAGVAAIFLVGQAITRFATSTASEFEVLGALGFTPWQRRIAAALGPALAAGAGGVLGAAAAVLASPWFPIGTAATFEPSPGLEADPLVLVAGVVLVPLLVAAGAVLAASAQLRRGAATTARTSAIAAAGARSRLPLPVVIGSRLALERGRGRQAVPVRPAFVGAVIGVLGTIAALTFSRGVVDAADNPERFGQTFELATFFGFNGEDFAPADEALTAIAEDEDVAAVNDARNDIVRAGDDDFDMFTLDPVDADVSTVVVDGRLPASEDEIALAPRTAEELDAAVGDGLDLQGSGGEQRMTVTGLAFVPMGIHNDYATGSWVTPEGYDGLSDGFKFHFGHVELQDGADAGAVGDRLSGELGLGFEPAQVPDEVAELRQVRSLPFFLAGFLALLGLGAVAHVLAASVRRRRHDLAALRALGLLRRQVRLIVLTQATIVGVLGVVLGMPLGVAAGRSLWRYVADSTPVQYLPPAAVLALIVIPPATLVLANLLAALPSHRAVSMDLGRALRVE